MDGVTIWTANLRHFVVLHLQAKQKGSRHASPTAIPHSLSLRAGKALSENDENTHESPDFASPEAENDTATTELVRFENVGLRYGIGSEILRDVTFSIPSHSFQFLTGPSGAGNDRKFSSKDMRYPGIPKLR